MKKRMILISLLAIAALALSGCGQKDNSTAEQAPKITQQPVMLSQATDIPAPEFDNTLPENYDPASEEDEGGLIANAQQQAATAYSRAGATPIPLDPVDMPTPTPRPALAFTYSRYTANKLGISFESVAGYEVDESQPDTYILKEPEALVKDNYPVQIVFQLSAVGNNYNIDNLKKDLRTKLEELGAVNYTKWQPTDISRRSLLGKDGYYANYRGEMFDGTVVRGRIHMAIVGGKLLTFNLSCPGWYNTDYMKVYTQIRNTIKQL